VGRRAEAVSKLDNPTEALAETRVVFLTPVESGGTTVYTVDRKGVVSYEKLSNVVTVLGNHALVRNQEYILWADVNGSLRRCSVVEQTTQLTSARFLYKFWDSADQIAKGAVTAVPFDQLVSEAPVVFVRPELNKSPKGENLPNGPLPGTPQSQLTDTLAGVCGCIISVGWIALLITLIVYYCRYLDSKSRKPESHGFFRQVPASYAKQVCVPVYSSATQNTTNICHVMTKVKFPNGKYWVVTKHVFVEGFKPYVKDGNKQISLEEKFKHHPTRDLSYCRVVDLPIPCERTLNYKESPASCPMVMPTINPDNAEYTIAQSMCTRKDNRLIYDCDTFNYQCGSPVVDATDLSQVYAVHAGTYGPQKGNYAELLVPPPSEINFEVEARGNTKGGNLKAAYNKRHAREEKDEEYDRKNREEHIRQLKDRVDRAEDKADEVWNRHALENEDELNTRRATLDHYEDKLDQYKGEENFKNAMDAREELEEFEKHIRDLNLVGVEEEFKQNWTSNASYAAWLEINRDQMTPTEYDGHRKNLKDLWGDLYDYFNSNLREATISQDKEKQSKFSKLVNNMVSHSGVPDDKRDYSKIPKKDRLNHIKRNIKIIQKTINESRKGKCECVHIQTGPNKCPLSLPVSSSKCCDQKCGGHHCSHWAQCKQPISEASKVVADSLRVPLEILKLKPGSKLPPFVYLETSVPKNVKQGAGMSATIPVPLKSKDLEISSPLVH